MSQDELSDHARSVIDANRYMALGTADGAGRLERVLTNDPGRGVARHADAGYELARETARERGVRIPMTGE